MPRFVEPGVDPPPKEAPNPVNAADWLRSELYRWLARLQGLLPKVVVYEASLTPSAVTANTTAEQTFTVTGLVSADTVFVNTPGLTAGTGIVGARVSAADTLALAFANVTGTSKTPKAGTYRIVAMRK